MAVGKRREQRIRTVLPIRVFGLDSSGKPFTDVAHTLDISRAGARLGGLKISLAVGDIIGVQRGTDKAWFRVMWVGAADTRCERQVGLSCIQPERCIWPLDSLAVQKTEDLMPPVEAVEKAQLEASKPEKKERRAHIRHDCNLGAEIQLDHSTVKLWARCTDLSSGGCYLETRSPLPPDTTLRLQLSNKTMTFNCWGKVRTSDPHFGMGVQFENLDPATSVVLGMVLETLSEETSAGNGTAATPETNLRMRAASVLESIIAFEGEWARCAEDPAIKKVLADSLKEAGETVSTIQRVLDSPLQENSELLAAQMLARRIREATAMNLDLCDQLRFAKHADQNETRELLHATTALARRLQSPQEGSAMRSPALSPLTRELEPNQRHM